MNMYINWAAAQTGAVSFTEITEDGLVQYWCGGLMLTGHEPCFLGTNDGPNKYPSREEAISAVNEWVRKRFKTVEESQV